MTGDDKLAHRGLPHHGTVDQPHDAAVRLTAHNGEFTKILVKRHEDALLITGPGQDRGVSWIGWPVADPDDVVPGVTE